MSLSVEDLTLYGIISFLILENVVELYLENRQIKVFETTRKVPKELEDAMTVETFEKARVYGLDKAKFSSFKTLVEGIIIASLELYFGIIAIFWYKAKELTESVHLNPENEIHVSCIFLLLITVIGTIKDLPWKIYGTFVLEAKHGFNKQTVGFFVKDQIKAFIVGQLISLPIASAIVYIVQWGGDYFFVYLWVFTGLVSLVLITVYPVFIAPLFDKYRPLDDGPLRTSIENLSASLKFPLTQLYVVEGSKRSAHSNAYFYGLWGSKRIVLFDTLLLNKGQKDDSNLKDDEKGKGCSDEEVLAVLGHELGHWKLGHITKNLIIMQINLFIMFMAFGYLFQYSPFYRALGFHDKTQPILVGLVIILQYVMAAFNAVVSFAMTVLSRRFEYQADEFAKDLGFATKLCKALIKLHIDNLGFPVYDWMYSSWHHSHPTLLQRIDRMKESKKSK
jgi:STE24 endopeptidase